MVLLHGWPDSVLRFERVLPLLEDVHVAVPALPGYPFARTWTGPPLSTTAMADAVAGVMKELGYERYVVSGGDIGSAVAEGLAARYGERVGALHLTEVPYRHLFTVDEAELTGPERAYLAAGRRWQRKEPVGRVDVPSAFTIFPHDLVTAPREFGERFFDVRVWEEPPGGGHVGAWERAQEFAAGVHAAVALLSS